LKAPDCPECVRLWREYQSATTNHIHLCGKHRIAELQRDYDREATLAGMVTEAEDQRNAARNAIRQHEVEAHGVSPETASDACGVGQ
jgi:hypothetical protein